RPHQDSVDLQLAPQGLRKRPLSEHERSEAPRVEALQERQVRLLAFVERKKGKLYFYSTDLIERLLSAPKNLPLVSLGVDLEERPRAQLEIILDHIIQARYGRLNLFHDPGLGQSAVEAFR